MNKEQLIEQYTKLCHLVVFDKDNHDEHLKSLEEIVLKIRKL